MGNTNIEWTDKTWNPTVGCSIVSPGCTNCYAMKMAARLESMSVAHEAANGGDPGSLEHYRGTTRNTRAAAVWTGLVRQAPPNIVFAPLRWKKPVRIFVNSMSDLFHESVSREEIDAVFAIMALCPHHTFQVLTKRAQRMHDYLTNPEVRNRIAWVATPGVLKAAVIQWKHLEPGEGWRGRAAAAGTTWPLPNVWCGVSAEDQPRLDERAPLLQRTPAAVRFLSIEPMLGPIDTYRGGFSVLQRHRSPAGREYARIDQVIVGGESGPQRRPFDMAWARLIRDQCRDAGVAFFMKQVDKKRMIPEDLMIREWPA